MTGYLTRLIARANGAEAVVRPVLTPAFGGRGEVELGAQPFTQQTDAARDDQNGALREGDESARSIRTLPAAPSPAGLPTVGRAPGPLDHRPNPEAEVPRTRQGIGAPETSAAELPSPARRSLGPDQFAQPDHAQGGPLNRRPNEEGEAARTQHAIVMPETPAAEPPFRARRPLGPSAPSVAGPQPSPSSEFTSTRLEAVHASFLPLPADPARLPANAARLPTDSALALASQAARRSETDEGEPSPILRIAIGRIEVRANLPRTALTPRAGAPPAQPVRRFTVAPKLTLEEYLNRSELRR